YAAETHPAAELSTVTTPGSRTELSATYDTVNDRIATLTDGHGGAWAYSGPASVSSAAAYDDAVLSSSPLDFWPLADAAGPLARDMVNGSVTAGIARPPATYSGVTLGAAGPTGFADGTAATFTGSGSQVAVPGGYFAGNGAESAELWFQTTTANGTLLSSATGTGGEPVNLWVSGGCLDATVATTLLSSNPLGGSCSGVQNVADGKWHQVILAVSPIETSNGFGSGTQTQGAVLYLDGASFTTAPIATQATLSPTGYTAIIGNGSHGGFTGSIADVSLYTRQLTATEASGHYHAAADTVTLQTTSINPFGPPPPATLPVLTT